MKEYCFVWSQRLFQTSKDKGFLEHLQNDDDLVRKVVHAGDFLVMCGQKVLSS